MFFAIGEQLNALTGLLLCLYMTWHHMENPKRDGLILMISGVDCLLPVRHRMLPRPRPLALVRDSFGSGCGIGFT